MIVERILRTVKVRGIIMTRPRVEDVRFCLYKIRCDIRILSYRIATKPPKKILEFRAEIWAITQVDAYGLKFGDEIKGEGFLCRNDVIVDYFILVTKWEKVAD